MHYYIGIDVGGTNLRAGAVTQQGKILSHVKTKSAEAGSAEEFAELCVALSRSAAEQAGISAESISGIGLGIPGMVDREKGVIIKTTNLPFRDVPLAEMMKKSWDTEVILGNDGNCAAVGEYFAGACRGTETSLTITLGTGIGGGYIVNGRIMTGKNHAAFEVGHMVIIQNGKPCNCGRKGCWERYASATGLKELTREEMLRSPDSLMWTLCDGDIGNVGGKTAFQAARQGDTAGKSVTDQYLNYLACGVTNLINIFQPEVLCIAGGVSNEEDDLFLEPLISLVEKERFTKEGPQTRIVKSALKGDAGLIGAALMAEELAGRG